LADDLTGHLLAVLVDDAHRLHVGGDLREPLLRLAPLALPEKEVADHGDDVEVQGRRQSGFDSAAAASGSSGSFFDSQVGQDRWRGSARR